MSGPWETLANPGRAGPGFDSVDGRQRKWLMDCLARNRETEFGLRHRFDRIDSIAAYRRRVPLRPYEEFADSIQRMAAGEADILFKGPPIAFERTGGSSGGAKLIPYSRQSLVDFSVALLPWIGSLVTRHRITRGTAYWAISPATRPPEWTSGGFPIGLPDGAYLGGEAARALSAVSAVPPRFGRVENILNWELLTLHSLVRNKDLVLVSVWSPTFFLRLLEGLNRHFARLSALLERGDCLAGHELPVDEAAAARLEDYRRSGSLMELWPDLRVISCWTAASSRPFAEALQSLLPAVTIQGKGLLATEGVTTAPNSLDQPVLAADSGFFEFLGDRKDIRNAWDLRSGDTYELIMTTSGGLYRYRTGDHVRFDGFSNGLPVLEFCGRGDSVSDLVGEKLTDAFVNRCLSSLPGFRMLVPITGADPHYTLVVDHHHGTPHRNILRAVEKRLMTNPQYAHARKIGQLGSLRAAAVEDPLGRYEEFRSSRCRLGEIKVPALCPQDETLIRLMVASK